MGQSAGQKATRPISPHLMQYRWGVHMMASITHRITGFILATAGMMTLVWWLSAISGGAESYASFLTYTVNAGEAGTAFQVACNWFFRLVALGVVYAFFQHFFSGLRHLVMDMGAGYELKTSRLWAQVVFVLAFLATAATGLFVYIRFLEI
jgi:succinate dehydrogenase / fumarate reductase, cytochrome b subunit